jgi:hypothetical protein
MSKLKPHYTSLEQRVAATFYYGFFRIEPSDASQVDLQSFFAILSRELYENPARFGIKFQQDEFIVEQEENEKDHKQALNRKISKSQTLIRQALEVLRYVAANGTIVNDRLVMGKDDFLTEVFQSPKQKSFFEAMAELGFHLIDEGERVTFHCEPTNAMLPALQALAKACAAHEDHQIGAFNFWHCDLRALDTPNYAPSVEDLLSLFMEEDIPRLMELHRYFIDRGFHTITTIYNPTNWNINYQGRQKVKPTPLYKVTFEDRYINPLHVYIKPATMSSLIPLLPQQSLALQEDYFARATDCRGAECGHCKNLKSAGPVRLNVQGKTRTVCRYVDNSVYPFTNESIPLIKEYEQMHAQLVDV